MADFTSQDLRIYAWVPRTEVVYIQAIIDAYDGLGRVRTERHDGDRSFLLFMLQSNQKFELLAVLDQISKEIQSPIEITNLTK